MLRKHSCGAVGLCGDDTGQSVNRKRSDGQCSVEQLRFCDSPWSLSMAVLILLLSVEADDIRSSREPCHTKEGDSDDTKSLHI